MRIGYSQGPLSRTTLWLSAAAAVAMAYLQTALLGFGIIS